MSEGCPATPPKEVVDKWVDDTTLTYLDFWTYLVTKGARWGADRELEAICEILINTLDGEICKATGTSQGAWDNLSREIVAKLIEIRRPDPPNLKQQALRDLNQLVCATRAAGVHCNHDKIRIALESIPEV